MLLLFFFLLCVATAPPPWLEEPEDEDDEEEEAEAERACNGSSDGLASLDTFDLGGLPIWDCFSKTQGCAFEVHALHECADGPGMHLILRFLRAYGD